MDRGGTDRSVHLSAEVSARPSRQLEVGRSVPSPTGQEGIEGKQNRSELVPRCSSFRMRCRTPGVLVSAQPHVRTELMASPARVIGRGTRPARTHENGLAPRRDEAVDGSRSGRRRQEASSPIRPRSWHRTARSPPGSTRRGVRGGPPCPDLPSGWRRDRPRGCEPGVGWR